MSGELKTGLIGLATIIALIFAVRFVRKANLFDRSTTIYGVFRTTGGIELNDKVMINGLPVGKVIKMEPSDDEVSRVNISMSIDQNLNIPSNSIAFITKPALSPSLVIIEHGSSTTYLQNNDNIRTKEEDSQLENLQAQAKPLAQKIQNITDSLSSILKNYNTKLDNKKQTDLKQRIEAINAQMNSYAIMAKQMDAKSTAYLNNLKNATGSYVNKRKQINQNIADANKKITDLNKMQLRRKVDSLNIAIAGFNRKISGFNSASTSGFMSNRDAYNSLNDELLKTEMMLDDIRMNPERYLNISVLGKSSKSPEITEPEATKQRREKNSRFNRKQQEEYKNK